MQEAEQTQAAPAKGAELQQQVHVLDVLLDRLDLGQRQKEQGPVAHRRQFLARGEFDERECVWCEPPGGCERGQRWSCKAAAVGRIEKHHRASRCRARRPCGVAWNHPSPITFAERRDVGLQHCNSRAVLLDEHGRGGAARQCLEAECAGAGKGVEHHRLPKRDAVRRELAMGKDV